MTRAETETEASRLVQSRRVIAAVATLLLLTALLRLPGITRPLVGNFATKNAVYAMIARNWAAGRADLWHPTVDVMVGGKRGWQMKEFPVAVYLTAWLWDNLGGSLDVWGRAQALAFSVGSVLLAFFFVRRRHGTVAATAASLALALSPVSIIYGQSFLLQASLVFFTIGTFYCLDRWLGAGHTVWLVLAAISLALLLLTKIYMIVLLLPLGCEILRSVMRRPEKDANGQERVSGAADPGLRNRQLAAAAALALAIIPAMAWYARAYRIEAPKAPNAHRVFFSVRRSTSDHRPPHPLLFRADFYRQVLDDLTGVVLTPIGFVLLLAGFLNRHRRRYIPWLLSMAVLVVLLPRKFYEMNYYMMAVLPPLCILIGLGWQVIYERLKPGRLPIACLLLAAVLLSLRYSVRPAFVTPEEDRGVVAAGRAIQQLTAEEEPVVTMHGTTIDLLYYCNRPGWAIDPASPALDQYARQGARYLVIVGSKESFGLTRVKEGNNFCVYELPPAGLR